MTELIKLTDAYGEKLLELGRQDDRIVAVDADVSKRMGTKMLGSEFPERHINVGIAEQNLIGTAAGLAAVGKIPFAGTFAIFITGRAYDQIRQAVAYPNLNVKIVGSHAGLSVGPDGATHQAYEDIALMRALPNMKILVPCDPLETKQATALAFKTEGPVYIRLVRPALPVILPQDYQLEFGKACVLREGNDITLMACGMMAERTIQVAEELADRGINARVINMSSIKPLDKRAVLTAARETAGIVTVEDHSIIGGLGSAVAEVMAEEGTGKLCRVGMPDKFGESGSTEELYEKYGLSIKDIMIKAEELL